MQSLRSRLDRLDASTPSTVNTTAYVAAARALSPAALCARYAALQLDAETTGPDLDGLPLADLAARYRALCA